MITRIPLQIKKGALDTYTSEKESIDAYMELLLTTPVGSCVSDPDFGFILNNLRFEKKKKNEGVVLNAEEDHSELYDKKVSGSSRNVNTFAVELKGQIENYEPRLEDVLVTMSYVREHRKIYITIKGIIAATDEPYQYQTTIKVWH